MPEDLIDFNDCRRFGCAFLERVTNEWEPGDAGRQICWCVDNREQMVETSAARPMPRNCPYRLEILLERQ